MRFAVMTDIHGNASALRAVLNDIDQKKLDHLFCLGDLIGIGYNTNEVLELLFSRDDISIISGNHDESVLAMLKDEPHPKALQVVREHHKWIGDRLNPKYIPLLEQLPRTIHKTINGQQCFFSHYYIEPQKLNQHISANPFHEIVEPSLPNLEQLFNGVDTDLICFGHHHPLHFFKGERTTFLNPGALGCNHKPIAPYAVVTLEDNGSISVDFEEIYYDNKNFLLGYEKWNVPEREFLIKAFHGNQLSKNS
ncbi:metallophosphoesterase family protein [Oceanobacillus senegalensis]|uniref:metallophosphoesterase family protein n=1 Tax=Oceanobacillus senegalensis TaxID=1936063 RepID=UPI000A307C6F|nr:metallophosphoesterase family protein [Oceanobacillus senegalensis]